MSTPEAPGTTTAPTTPTRPVADMVSLLDEASRRGIRLCSWKSNSHLAEALAGETDIDLLVDRRDAAALRELVANRGVRRLDPSPGGAHPGVEHYLGMDDASGRLYHLHVHYRLVLGERHVKNYHLPMEEQVLRSTRPQLGVPVPAPEVELAVLAIRALLKYRLRDGVKDTLAIRTIGIPSSIRSEIGWLLERTTIDDVGQVVRDGPMRIPEHLLVSLLEIVSTDPRSGVRLLWLRTQLRGALRPYARRGRAGVIAESARVVWARRQRLRRRPARRRMTPASGGSMIALVGADGSGKSTLCRDVASWLGWKLDVHVVYLGSKEASRRTAAAYLTFRVLRRAHRSLTARQGGLADGLARPVAAARDLAMALHCLSVARGRLDRFHAARLLADEGSVVLFDRFPLEPLTGRREHRVLDGPRIEATVGTRGRVVAALAHREHRLYARLLPPDRMLALRVDPAIASARKPDHDPAVIAIKSAAVAGPVEWPSVGPDQVRSVDAGQPLADVRMAVQRELWHGL